MAHGLIVGVRVEERLSVNTGECYDELVFAYIFVHILWLRDYK